MSVGEKRFILASKEGPRNLKFNSETVVVLHYYDKTRKIWGKLDLYPIYQHDMVDILSKNFIVEKIYHDFEETQKEKSLFVQYLAKRK